MLYVLYLMLRKKGDMYGYLLIAQRNVKVYTYAMTVNNRLLAKKHICCTGG